MSVTLRPAGSARGSKPGAPGPRYKWVTLSNTTLGALLASINTSIMLIALPDVFRGIGIDPIKPGNGSLLLGHPPAPPRLWLQPDPAVGRHLPAAAHCRVLAGRAGLGLSVGPFRRATVRHRRHGGRRGLVPAAGPAPRRLRLLAVRPCHVAERDRHGAVHLPEPGRRHEQPPPGQRGAGAGMAQT